jgi:hypothetical protein
VTSAPQVQGTVLCTATYHRAAPSMAFAFLGTTVLAQTGYGLEPVAPHALKRSGKHPPPYDPGQLDVCTSEQLCVRSVVSRFSSQLWSRPGGACSGDHPPRAPRRTSRRARQQADKGGARSDGGDAQEWLPRIDGLRTFHHCCGPCPPCGSRCTIKEEQNLGAELRVPEPGRHTG